jgi:hypothetical protein
VGQEAAEVGGRAKAVHAGEVSADVVQGDAAAGADDPVVDRGHVELVVDPFVGRDHGVRGVHEVAAPPVVVQANGRLVRDHLLFHHLDRRPIGAQTDERPLGIIGGHGHDQAVGARVVHRRQVVVDRNVAPLVAIGDHQRIAVVDDRTGQQDRARRARGHAVDQHHLGAGSVAAQLVVQLVSLDVLAQADEGEAVRDPRGQVADDQLDHRHAMHRDQRLGIAKSDLGEPAAPPRHGDHDVQHCRPFPFVRGFVMACRCICRSWRRAA